jgi:hypothetical protein
MDNDGSADHSYGAFLENRASVACFQSPRMDVPGFSFCRSIVISASRPNGGRSCRAGWPEVV